jgi:PAS domain S-box-containing protein
MQGWGWQSVHHPDSLPAVMERWTSAIAAGTSFEMEFPLRAKDGMFHTFLTRIDLLKDADGRLVRWLGTNTNISERKRAEELLAAQAAELARSRLALQEQKLMLQSVLNSMQEGLIAADEKGNFILWNHAATRLVGLDAANLTPEQWSRHYGAYLADEVTPFPLEQNPLFRAIRGEISSAEIYLCNPGLGTGVLVESNGSPLRDSSGTIRGGVIALRDITRRKADELEIRKLNEDLEHRITVRTAQLQAANEELQTFTYSVSHDLRAPLRHIGGFSRILLHDFSSGMSPEAQGYLQRIGDAVTRMGLLVDGLLSLARLGRQALKVKPQAMNGIVEQVVALLQSECEGRAVEWRIAQLPWLECDRTLMVQVFQNLLSNALKYTRNRDKAVIEVSSHQPEGQAVTVLVRDNGCGFNMQYAGKLFEVFQRMHAESEYEGTGVGLATVHRIIQKHGGSIWAEAEVDQGATFYFTLGNPGGAGQAASLPNEANTGKDLTQVRAHAADFRP